MSVVSTDPFARALDVVCSPFSLADLAVEFASCVLENGFIAEQLSFLFEPLLLHERQLPVHGAKLGLERLGGPTGRVRCEGERRCVDRTKMSNK